MYATCLAVEFSDARNSYYYYYFYQRHSIDRRKNGTAAAFQWNTTASGLNARTGSWVDRIDPLRFLAGCRERRLNKALSVLSQHTFLSVLLFIRATFCLALVSVCI